MRMPAAVQRLLTDDGRLSASESLSLQGADRSVIEALASERFVNALSTGAGDALESAAGRPLRFGEPLRDAANLLVAGTLEPGARGGNVSLLQASLQAIGSRTGNAQYVLPQWGADGGYGAETVTAVTAFQRDHGLPVTGTADAATSTKVDEALRATSAPEIRRVGGPATPKRLLAVARYLIDVDGDRYGTHGPDGKLLPFRCRDPQHAGWNPNRVEQDPHGNAYSDMPFPANGSGWKCNLFAGTVMSAAGYEPPRYGPNNASGNYPIAIEMHRFTREVQGSRSPHNVFERVAPPLDVTAMTPAEAKRAIGSLLALARPGDFIFVKHEGDDTADGGHCRLVMDGSRWRSDGTGTIDCAEARRDEARVETHGWKKFYEGEEVIWLLRPSKAGGAPINLPTPSV
ncbi:MAG: peptidoglycan-binding domain-containing protein [Myxococcota bacterium]